MFLSAGSIDITPSQPVSLFGFAERHGSYSKVHDKLEINLSVLKQNGALVLLYSIDTLFVPEEFVSIVLNQFGNDFGLQEKDIWMAATHTHFAPSLDKDKPGLGKLDEGYFNVVKEKLLQLTATVLSSQFKMVTVQYGNSKSELNVNRRKKLIRPKSGFWLYNKVLMYPDYDGVKDDNIHVVSFVGEGGNTEMVLWNYACHPVGFTHRSQVTAEFIGAIREQFRGHYKKEQLPVVFMLGFAGNLKPDVTPVTHTKLKDKIRYFFQLGPKYTRFPDTARYLQWTELLWKEVQQAIEKSGKTNAGAIESTQSELPLSDVIGEDNHQNIHFKKLRFSDSFQLTGISAEVLAEYKDIVADVVKTVNSINVGCLAGTRIYLPTDKHLDEGGYEVHHFKHRFGIKGDFKNGLSNKIKNALSEL